MWFRKHRPLYREVLREAFAFTWHHRQLWVFALFAAVLQTGGIVDVILTSAATLTRDARALITGTTPVIQPFNLQLSGIPAVLNFFGRMDSLLLVALIVVAIYGASVIAQGALVYGLGTRVQGKPPSFRGCLTVGARHFWPVAFLNIVTLGVIWIARFLVLIPYAYAAAHPTWLSVLSYFFLFLIFLAVVIAATAVHLFSLNAIILESEHLWKSLVITFKLFKKSWVVVIEIALILFAIACGLMLAACVFVILAEIPLLLFMIFAALFHWLSLLEYGFGVGVAIAVVIMCFFGAWTVCFQYAAWQRLYLRADRGNALSKIHRVLNAVLNRKA